MNKNERRKKMDKQFGVNSICREDLREYVDDDFILPNISDSVMKRIAEKLGDALMLDAYWISLEVILDDMDLLE